MPEQRLKSIVRMAMTNALFREEPDRDRVGHSAISAFLAKDSDVYAYATYMCSRSAPMAMRMADAHRRWGPGTTETYETAYNVAFDTDLPFFDHLGRNEDKMGEFARYMRNVRSSEAVHLKHLIAGYSWRDIRESGMVVDVSVFHLASVEGTLTGRAGRWVNRDLCDSFGKRVLSPQVYRAGPPCKCREWSQSGG